MAQEPVPNKPRKQPEPARELSAVSDPQKQKSTEPEDSMLIFTDSLTLPDRLGLPRAWAVIPLRAAFAERIGPVPA